MGNAEEEKKNGEAQRYRWGTQKKKRRMMSSRDIAGERRRKRRMVKPRDIAGERRRRRIRIVNPRDTAWERRRRKEEVDTTLHRLGGSVVKSRLESRRHGGRTPPSPVESVQ